MIIAVLSINLKIIVKCFLVFAGAMIITRIAGLRTFAKMSSIDFASTIAVGSIIASTITGSISVINGILALCIIVFLQISSARLMKNYSWFSKLASNQPLLLMHEGEILQDNLDKSGVSKADLMAKLREANALQLSNVKAVVFETTGDIAVLHSSDDIELDKELLLGVAKT